MVLTEGWDMPEVGCCILARPTKKMGLYRQMVGRVLRTASGKSDAIILDHSGAVFRHGFPEDHVEWTLHESEKAESPTHQKRLESYSSRLLECTQCETIREAGKPCPHCGFLPQRPPRDVSTAAGDLGLVDRNGSVIAPIVDKHRWWAELTHIQNERGYSPKWAACNFKQKFGDWPGPPGATTAPQKASIEVLRWVKHTQIRWAKSRSAA